MSKETSSKSASLFSQQPCLYLLKLTPCRGNIYARNYALFQTTLSIQSPSPDDILGGAYLLTFNLD